jgi:hypothetical protein
MKELEKVHSHAKSLGGQPGMQVITTGQASPSDMLVYY